MRTSRTRARGCAVPSSCMTGQLMRTLRTRASGCAFLFNCMTGQVSFDIFVVLFRSPVMFLGTATLGVFVTLLFSGTPLVMTLRVSEFINLIISKLVRTRLAMAIRVLLRLMTAAVTVFRIFNYVILGMGGTAAMVIFSFTFLLPFVFVLSAMLVLVRMMILVVTLSILAMMVLM